jgi:TolA-binding protein
MRARSRRIAATLVVASTVASLVLSAGCLWTSHAEGKKLRALTGEHDQRLTKLEAGLRTERETLHAAVGSAQLKVQQLEEVLERATAVVTRNSADTGALVQELQTQIASLEGQIAELRNTNEQLTRQLSTQRSEMDERITQIARKAGIDMPLPSAEIPADRVEHFAAARRAHQASDYSRARALFREYLSRYAGDGESDDAQYWIGASYLQENKPATALGELRRVIAEHAAGDAIDDALLDMGDAFYRLHACTDARTTLEALVRTQPSSPLVSRAREKLREIQRAPRGHCTS